MGDHDLKNLGKIERDITAELKKRQLNVLAEYSKIKGAESPLGSLHGTIALNKAHNLDLVHGMWPTYEDYLSSWLSGLKDIIASGRAPMMKEIFKVQAIREYILLFLERDFYKHYKVRVKQKPQENLWSIWFGSSNFTWGLLIAPRFIDDQWENKPALVRKVAFDYWTIGHVLTTGFVDPENDKLYQFRDLDDFLNFYQAILKRVSNSIYEKKIFDLYSDYIRSSANPLTEPLLIPEFRYDGLQKNHKYRLDFTILNSHTGERIGFELSPQSSHMSVSGITTKTQVDMNKDLAKKWGHEMAKRNEYFQQYGITTITFTDEQLKDMNHCFDIMKYYLMKRKTVQKSVQQLISEIISI